MTPFIAFIIGISTFIVIIVVSQNVTNKQYHVVKQQAELNQKLTKELSSRVEELSKEIEKLKK